MKKIVLLFWLILPMGLFSQENSEAYKFMSDLFFNLPVDANKTELINAINDNSSLGNARTSFNKIAAPILENKYFHCSSRPELHIFPSMFRENKMGEFRITFFNDGEKNSKKTL